MPVCDIVYRYDLLIKLRNSADIFMSIYRCIEGFIWTYVPIRLHMPVCDIVYRYDLLIKLRNSADIFMSIYRYRRLYMDICSYAFTHACV